MSSHPIKPVLWVGSSYKDFRSFPDLVQDVMGFALYQAQIGRMHGSAKPLKGFGGASVVEIVDDHQGDTYRTVYTVKFDEQSMSGCISEEIETWYQNTAGRN